MKQKTYLDKQMEKSKKFAEQLKKEYQELETKEAIMFLEYIEVLVSDIEGADKDIGENLDKIIALLKKGEHGI